MLSCCANNYLAVMPDITIYMNCDTRLAINLSMFKLSEYDELIFTIKNFSYIDSSYVFMYRARKSDMNKHGEVIFNIDPDISKNIKPGAFYNFTLLVNAFNPTIPTEYKKLTDNGKIIIEYGAHNFDVPEPEAPNPPFSEILAARLEETDKVDPGMTKNTLVAVEFEEVEEV